MGIVVITLPRISKASMHAADVDMPTQEEQPSLPGRSSDAHPRRAPEAHMSDFMLNPQAVKRRIQQTLLSDPTSPSRHRGRRRRLSYNQHEKHNYGSRCSSVSNDSSGDHANDPLGHAPSSRQAEHAANSILPLVAASPDAAPAAMLETRLAAMSTSALCSASQAARRSLLALVTEDVAADAPIEHDSDSVRRHLRRLLHQVEPVRVCRACFSAIRNVHESLSRRSRHHRKKSAFSEHARKSSSDDPVHILEREIKRTIESVAQASVIVGLAIDRHADSSSPSTEPIEKSTVQMPKPASSPPPPLQAASPTAPQMTAADQVSPAHSESAEVNIMQIDSNSYQNLLRLLFADLLNLLFAVVADRSGTSASAEASSILINADDGNLGRHLGSILCASFLRALRNRDTSPFATTCARLTTIWIHKRLMADENSCRILNQTLPALRDSSYTSNSTDLLCSMLDNVFYIIKNSEKNLAQDAHEVANICFSVVGRLYKPSNSVNMLSEICITTLFRAIDTVSLLAERQKPLRPLIHNDPSSRTKLVDLLVSVTDRLDQLLPSIAPPSSNISAFVSALNLVRVICQVMILCSLIPRQCSLAMPQSSEFRVFVAVNRVFVMLARAPWTAVQLPLEKVVDGETVKIVRDVMVRVCYPSLLQSLVDVAPFEINTSVSASGPSTVAPATIEQNSQSIVCDGLLEALVHVYLVTQDSRHALKYSMQSPSIIVGYKLLRYMHNLSVATALTAQFVRVDPALTSLFSLSLGRVVRSNIVLEDRGFGTYPIRCGGSNSAGSGDSLRLDIFDITRGLDQSDFFAHDHEGKEDYERYDAVHRRFVDTTMQLLSVLLERPASRLALMDVGISSHFLCMHYVRKMLSDAGDLQMQTFQKMMKLISRMAQDSSVKFKLKAGVFDPRGIESTSADDGAQDKALPKASAASGVVLQPPSSNGVVAFMAAIIIGSAFRLCSRSLAHIPKQVTSMSGHNPRFLVDIFSQAVRFLNQHFGHDRSVMQALSRATLTDTLLPSIVLVQTSLNEMSDKAPVSVIESLLCILDTKPMELGCDVDDTETVQSFRSGATNPISQAAVALVHMHHDEMLNTSAKRPRDGEWYDNRITSDLVDDDDVRSDSALLHISAETKRDAAHLLESLLRFDESLIEILRSSSAVSVPAWMHQHQPVSRITRTTVTSSDAVVRSVLMRIVRRMFHSVSLVQEMVFLCGYSLIIETLLDCASESGTRRMADAAMDALLCTASSSSPFTNTANDQQQQAEVLSLAHRTLKYAEQSVVSNQSLSLRDRASVAVCYLAADRLIGRHHARSMMPFDGDAEYAARLAAKSSEWKIMDTLTLPSPESVSFLQSMFAAVMIDSDESSGQATTGVHGRDVQNQDGILDMHGNPVDIADHSDDISSDNHAADISGHSSHDGDFSTTSVARWSKERMVRALQFLGWRYRSCVEPFGTLLISSARADKNDADRLFDDKHFKKLMVLLAEERHDPGSCARLVTVSGNVSEAVTLVFPSDSRTLVCDINLLKKTSEVLDAMLSQPFLEHSSHRIVIENAGCDAWAKVLAFVHRVDANIHLTATDHASSQQESYSDTQVYIDDVDTVEILFECANQYLVSDLRRSCIIWMTMAAEQLVQIPSWRRSQQLFAWLHRHPGMHQDVSERLFERLGLCILQALLASVMDHDLTR